jgi:assimilatory nitrate reductase catalytic subunit
MNARSPQASVPTTCPYCGVGCGVLARPDGRGDAVISGDPDHPANFGRLCSKGFALNETLDLDGRLLHPMRRQADGTLARVSWDSALDTAASGLSRIIEGDGPDAVAFYLSGQLLTEDYYVANKLMKGFLGSGNVDTNSRLCMASTLAGHRRAFGADVVPGSYDDLDQADLVILVGSNTAWCHPVLYQRILRNRTQRGAKIVVIDPRRTITAEEADLFLPIAPGMDTGLFAGLLVHLADAGKLDHSYIDAHTSGFEPAFARAREIAPDRETTARLTGLPGERITDFFNLFGEIEKTVTCFSQGVNQSAQGTDKVNAIINCHLATGRIGKPGTGPFSLTGQPNAMGGREVGGLANQLAAHMGFSVGDVDRVRRFWNAPRMAGGEGLKAIEMFDAIEQGKIKALWVMGTNPAVSLPRARAVSRALSKLELFIVSENVLSNDTVNSGAHLLLPAAAWGEKDGTVTNSERRISRQRSFLPVPGEAKPDWWIVCEVARRMGFAKAFHYRSAADIYREHAALSCFENNGARAFDIGGLAALSDAEYNALAPVQWPIRADGSVTPRFFSEGRFFTPDRKAHFVAPEMPALNTSTCEQFPLRLNTGRLRDQWHTMTRTGKSVRLGAHRPEPLVEVHPRDAATYRLKHDGFAKVTTRHGQCLLKVCVSAGQRPGSIFVPIHWSDATAASARVGDLVAAGTDPFSGQPESKATPASVAPVEYSYTGIALARRAIDIPAAWWARVPVANAAGYLFADNDGPMRWHDLTPRLFGKDAVLTQYLDRQRGIYRAAAFVEGRLEGCVFFAPAGESVLWNSARALFADDALAGMVQNKTLHGIPFSDPEAMPVVCACFGVGLTAIRHAMTARNVNNVEDIGRALRAGTRCGSCLPELRSIVGRELKPVAVAAS